MKHIELATQRVTIQAPKALCFEVIAAAGETVEKRSDTERVVDFDLEHKGELIKTRELLNLRPPDAIDYRWLDGPLPFVEETISFVARGDRTTDMTYEGSFSLGPRVAQLAGWAPRFGAPRGGPGDRREESRSAVEAALDDQAEPSLLSGPH